MHSHFHTHKFITPDRDRYTRIYIRAYLGLRAHEETRHVEVVHSHVLKDTAAPAHVLHRRRRGVPGRKLNLKKNDAGANASERQGGWWEPEKRRGWGE